MATIKCPVCGKDVSDKIANCPYCKASMEKLVESIATKDSINSFANDKDNFLAEEYISHRSKLIARSITFIVTMVAITTLFLKLNVGIWESPLVASLLASGLALSVGRAFEGGIEGLVERIKDDVEELFDTFPFLEFVGCFAWLIIIVFKFCLKLVPIAALGSITLLVPEGWRDIAYPILFFVPHVLVIVCTILDIRYLIENKEDAPKKQRK